MSIFSARSESVPLQVISAVTILVLGAFYRDFSWQEERAKAQRNVDIRNHTPEYVNHWDLTVRDATLEQVKQPWWRRAVAALR